jgi:hypothetical protein
MNTQLELHIEELMLEGVSPYQAAAIGEIVQQELAYLFEQKGIPHGLKSEAQIHNLSIPQLEVSGNASVGALGKSIANNLYQGLANETFNT